MMGDSDCQVDRNTTITVVGAGPAGLSSAIVLARAGYRVVIREWHKTVGTRFHGDYQGLENWSESTDVLDDLKFARIRPDFDYHAVYSGTAFDALGTAYPICSEEPLFYLIRRGQGPGTLDHGLLRQAQEAGVEVRFGDRVKTFSGPGIFAAGPRVADAIATGYIFETDMLDGYWICFDNSLAPKGYSYLLIHGGSGTVASCMFARFNNHSQFLNRTVAMFRDRVGLEMRSPRLFGGFANFRLPRTGMQGSHPVIGEHAGFQDALAGFGLRHAFRSGIMAAHSLIEGSSYTHAWRSELLPQLRASVTNRFLFSLAGDRGWRMFLANHLSGQDARVALLRLYCPTLLTHLLYPFARYHYRETLRDRSCDKVDCTCIWCRCGDHALRQGKAHGFLSSLSHYLDYKISL